MRHWSNTWKRHIFTIGPGGVHLAQSDELVETLLGSCVAACIRDPYLGIGGMNHVMVPMEAPGQGGRLTATAYGSYAMEVLINLILGAGGQRDRLEVKLFGGGKMLSGMTDIGARNVEFMREYVRKEGLTLLGGDLGGIWPRKVVYEPATGRIKMKRLPSPMEEIARRELDEANEAIAHQPVSEAELF